MAVNPTSWKSLTLADRDQPFDADDAIARMVERANLGGGAGDAKEFGKGFLWRATDGDPLNRDSYRLPIADVIDGKLELVPHAVYAAAALLSGAHGGLPNVPDEDKEKIRDIISEIYIVLRDTFNDPRIRPPWDRGRPPEERSDADMTTQLDWNVDPRRWDSTQWALWYDDVEFASDPKEPYGDVEYADPGYQDDGKKRYPLDSEEHCRAAWSYINMPKNAAKYSPEELAKVKAKIKKALKKYGVEVSEDEKMTLIAAFDPRPPRSWFDDPQLPGPTPLTVTEDGRVYGHLATWGECHTGIGNVCVTAPHSVTDYKYFKTGEVVCDDGTKLAVGKITLGVGHANPSLGYIPAADHYDSSAACVAVVRPGEDKYGIWMAGGAVPGLDDRRIAELRRSPLSGDWRRVNSNLELIAALAVNVPGFPVVRASAGEQQTLLAAGIVTEPVPAVADEKGPSKGQRLEALRVASRARRLAALKGQ